MEGEEFFVDVEIDSAETHGRVSTFSGSFLLGGRRYRFSGIAVMTVGGPTIGVSLTSESEAELLSSGFSNEQVERILAEVQRRVVEGSFRLGGDVRLMDD
ncbi:MAG: hypothetical protein RMJ28_05430 [Nitrososphaerota archaeon]|nr:hypothetical protein [Candidatus Calditenuaceae archaeon]MDW8073656.1 hypothetical protein [Nitrososphaerota archaeon]